MPACAHKKTQAQHNIPEICRLDNHQIELCGAGFYKFLECGHLNIKRAPYPYRREKFTGHTGMEQLLGVSLVLYRPTLDCQALSIIALTSKFQRSSVTLLT